MLEKVEKYIDSHQLLSNGAKVIVGLSGGADSMALLDALVLLGYDCVAAHCNFHLRGDESDADTDFVKKWCKNVDVSLKSIDFDTRQYAKDKKISIEMAARELRYTWFNILLQQHEADAIAVAHHKDDSVETVLLNLFRGTGIRGLTGISPQKGKVVRPLLGVSRDEIERYIAERDIPFRTDSSNEDDIFNRNFIRHQILPRLQTLNPSVSEAISRTSIHLGEVQKIYVAAVEKDIDRVLKNNRIDIQALRNTVSPLSVLFEILSSLGFTSSTIQDVKNSLESLSGKQFFSPTHRLVKDRNYFLMDEIASQDERENSFQINRVSQDITLPIHLNIRIAENDVAINKTSSILYADADKLSFPLILRKWKPGDWFIPFGMTGRKKLSDYFTNRKFSIKDKEDVWVMVSGNDIVWIVGERADNRFRVTEKTKTILIAEKR